MTSARESTIPASRAASSSTVPEPGPTGWSPLVARTPRVPRPKPVVVALVVVPLVVVAPLAAEPLPTDTVSGASV